MHSFQGDEPHHGEITLMTSPKPAGVAIFDITNWIRVAVEELPMMFAAGL